MHFISSFLFAASSNMDNLVIGLSYGLKKVKLPISTCVFIACLTSLGTAAAMLMGKYVLSFLPEQLGNAFGSVLILLLGIWGLIKCLARKNESDFMSHTQPDNRTISFREASLIGLALSINNISIGIGASVTGMDPILTTILSFSFSLLLLQIGNLVGNSSLAQTVGKYGEASANLLIIFLGLYELLI